MIKEDFIIQTEVRRMLIRANIDYSKIDLGTVRGVVYLRGLFYLSRIPVGDEGRAKEFIAKTLYALEKKARSISGVTDVVFQFVNWKKEMGQWIPIQWTRKEERRGGQKAKEHEDKTNSDLQTDSEGA
jgi:hypothetical protein